MRKWAVLNLLLILFVVKFMPDGSVQIWVEDYPEEAWTHVSSTRFSGIVQPVSFMPYIELRPHANGYYKFTTYASLEAALAKDPSKIIDYQEVGIYRHFLPLMFGGSQ